MADQTHCSKCNGHLRGGDVWCNECGYIHIRCSGLASGRDHYAGFICQTCNLAAAPQDDTNTPPAATPQANPLTTVEINQNDTDTSPNVTPPTPADFWTKTTLTHTDFIKKMLLWNSPLEAPICHSQQKQNWTLLHRKPQHYLRWSCRKIAKLECSTLLRDGNVPSSSGQYERETWNIHRKNHSKTNGSMA